MAKQSSTKGKSVFQQYKEDNDLLQDLPNWKIKRLCMSNPVVISGPYEGEVPDKSFKQAYGSTISTYPHYPDNASREGDPMCDSYRIHTHKNGILFCVTDGCNWGERPKEAANRAKNAFVVYLSGKMGEVKTIKEIGDVLISALHHANHAIVFDKNDPWMAGTTTLLGGVVVQIDNKHYPTDPSWAFVCCTIGDCKAFVFKDKEKEVVDITAGNRIDVTDARDPGGRIGPYINDGEPDLRNLALICAPVAEKDIVFVVSDGVHDNLDPQTLGKSPAEANIKGITAGVAWDSLDRDMVSHAKMLYECKLLQALIGADETFISPRQISKKLMDHCRLTTSSSREFMEQNPNLPLASDYAKYPGKMDHTTCAAFRIGCHDPYRPTSQRESNDLEVWPY
eukprot:CAMPEP_0168520060 /NCGR_PEP_ID=MMETSP0405-20121227/7721_1 /TAXON_ID=498012 /ORGANISM="Trichosphaerium sp, Strain Am-I-7 wt" /LENGTH=394 /DNA_ID=CAMNT_0008540787 /DNA_START=37 /DNA_END=1221 /DNA_ORIENTATION=-